MCTGLGARRVLDVKGGRFPSVRWIERDYLKDIEKLIGRQFDRPVDELREMKKEYGSAPRGGGQGRKRGGGKPGAGRGGDGKGGGAANAGAKPGGGRPRRRRNRGRKPAA